MRTSASETARQDEQVALDDLGEQLRQALKPVQANAAFVMSLRSELVDGAKRQAVAGRGSRRTALVAAAAVGSVISVASVIGAVIYFVTRRRAQAHPARG